jgi:hypothetical protein
MIHLGLCPTKISANIRAYRSLEIDSGAQPASYAMLTESLSLKLKRWGLGGDHSALSNAEAKKEQSYKSTPRNVFLEVSITFIFMFIDQIHTILMNFVWFDR